MGKRLNQQRRGKGSPTWKSPRHRYVKRISLGKVENKKGVVFELRRDALRSAPLAFIRFEDGEEIVVPAASGMSLGQIVEKGGSLKSGNIVTLANVPEGSKVYCVELRPGDGGKLARSAGSFVSVVSKEGDYVTIKLPSGKLKKLPANCRAIFGQAAGSGIKEKPFLKAGKKYHVMKAKHRYWPKVAASSMNAVEHPFGGGRVHRHVGKPQTSPRNAPPGRKVGYIAARRVGRKKGKR